MFFQAAIFSVMKFTVFATYSSASIKSEMQIFIDGTTLDHELSPHYSLYTYTIVYTIDYTID